MKKLGIIITLKRLKVIATELSILGKVLVHFFPIISPFRFHLIKIITILRPLSRKWLIRLAFYCERRERLQQASKL
ncbi:hypothetical protein WG66_006460 [Moniliophthora roreri]|nr:hypothetical protein WG66_006460 [Moniliophthora roreri]